MLTAEPMFLTMPDALPSPRISQEQSARQRDILHNVSEIKTGVIIPIPAIAPNTPTVPLSKDMAPVIAESDSDMAGPTTGIRLPTRKRAVLAVSVSDEALTNPETVIIPVKTVINIPSAKQAAFFSDKVRPEKPAVGVSSPAQHSAIYIPPTGATRLSAAEYISSHAINAIALYDAARQRLPAHASIPEYTGTKESMKFPRFKAASASFFIRENRGNAVINAIIRDVIKRKSSVFSVDEQPNAPMSEHISAVHMIPPATERGVFISSPMYENSSEKICPGVIRLKEEGSLKDIPKEERRLFVSGSKIS